jgi:hypothetical protein
VEPPLWAPRRVNRPSKHSDGRLSIRELLLLGCGCLCLGVRGLGLTAFCGLETMNPRLSFPVLRFCPLRCRFCVPVQLRSERAFPISLAQTIPCGLIDHQNCHHPPIK